MSLKVFINEDSEHGHEREVFTTLTDLLQEEYASSKDPAALLLNFKCGGKSIDAAFIKQDAFIIIEFKNYGGKISFKDNGPWYADNIKIEAGDSINPTEQTFKYRNAVCDFLAKNIQLDIKNPEWRKFTKAMVTFHNPITLGEIPANFFSTNLWIKVTDIKNSIKTINQITFNKISLDKTTLYLIPQKLGLSEIKTRKQKSIEELPMAKIDELLLSLLILKEELEVESLLTNELDSFRKKHDELTTSFSFDTSTKLINRNLTKVLAFEKEISEFKNRVANEIERKIIIVSNSNTNANFILEPITLALRCF